MIPFLVALLPVGVNQGWYERGGAVNQAFITIVLNIVCTEGLKLFQYMALQLGHAPNPTPHTPHLPLQVHGALQPVHPRALRRLAAAEE